MVTVREEDSSIVFRSAGMPSLPVKSRFRRRQLDSMRNKLRASLTQFITKANEATAQPERRKWGTLNDAMAILRRTGQDIGYLLFPSADVPAVQEYCRRACQWRDSLDRRPKIELNLPELGMVPLELIPLFQRRPAGLVKDAPSFLREARSYLGFAAIVKRNVLENPSNAAYLNGNPTVRVRLFQYAGLDAVDEVEPAIRNYGVRTSRPWPDGPLSSQTVEQTLCGSLLESVEQILYFGCHCTTTDPDPDEYRITLSHDGQTKRPVRLGAMKRYFWQHGPRKTIGPLVFLNACGGSAMVPSSIGSFPEFFLNENFTGYIGTETKVPDRSAAAFAKHFFQQFLSGVPLGEAVLLARRALLNRGDPTGILYTVYAPSELLVRQQRK
jgi:CHAT domain